MLKDIDQIVLNLNKFEEDTNYLLESIYNKEKLKGKSKCNFDLVNLIQLVQSNNKAMAIFCKIWEVKSEEVTFHNLEFENNFEEGNEVGSMFSSNNSKGMFVKPLYKMQNKKWKVKRENTSMGWSILSYV